MHLTTKKVTYYGIHSLSPLKMFEMCFWEENKSKTWNKVKSCGSQATLPTKMCKHTHTYTGSGEGCVDQHTMMAVQANRRSLKHVSYTTLSAPNKPTSLTSTPNFKPRLHQESTPLFSRMKKKHLSEKSWVSCTDSPFPPTADCREETA